MIDDAHRRIVAERRERLLERAHQRQRKRVALGRAVEREPRHPLVVAPQQIGSRQRDHARKIENLKTEQISDIAAYLVAQ